MSTFNFFDRDVLITTSHFIEGADIVEYKGVIVADITPGRHVGKDLMASLRNIFGGRSKSWEQTLKDNQEEVLRELVNKAEELGANAVISLNIEDESIGGGGMMNIKAVGTAVVIESRRS